MSTYQTPPGYGQPRRHGTRAQSRQRPATLTGAAAAAWAAVGLNIIGAAGILASGMDVVKEQIARTTTTEAGAHISPALVNTSTDRAKGLHTIYTALAGSTIFWSLVLALLAWFALRGGRATRILSAVILIISVLFKATDLFIAIPTVTVIVDGLFVAVALIAIVMFFLPSSNAYRKMESA